MGGRLHFLVQVVFIFWVRSSSFLGSGRIHFLGQVVFLFWVRLSSFFGSGFLTTWNTQSQHQDRCHCCQHEFTCTYRSLDRSLDRSLGLQPIRSQIRCLEKKKEKEMKLKSL